MRIIWDKLTRNQQYAIMFGGVVVTLLLLMEFAFFPLYDAREQAKRALTTNDRTIKELIPLTVEYKSLKDELQQVQRIITGRPGDFNLYSYVEKKSGEAGVKPLVKYINPAKSSRAGSYEETSVEIKIEKVTLRQLTGLIYLIESPQDLVRVGHVSITKNKEMPEYLNALIQIVTYITPKR